MWARVVEFMLGCWLAVSPFIFQHPADNLWPWTIDWTAASLVILFALLSYWRPLKHIHLATAAVAVALVAIGRLSSWEHPPPAAQNQIVTGLLLLMFALVPSDASQPPGTWQAELRRQGLA
jgi:hypothetical protein